MRIIRIWARRLYHNNRRRVKAFFVGENTYRQMRKNVVQWGAGAENACRYAFDSMARQNYTIEFSICL